MVQEEDGPVSGPQEILAILRSSVLDEPERGLTAERFDADPVGWQEAAEDFGISMLPTHADPNAAQADAERCLAALVGAGWVDQAEAEVCAHVDHTAGGWRGGINLAFGLLAPDQRSTGVPYERVKDSGSVPLAT
jgi:hypothetical protein